MNKKVITVKRDGSMQFVYDDKLRGLLQQGQATVRRASHVEPMLDLSDEAKAWLRANRPTAPQCDTQSGTLWWCDLLPSGGPVLGPFDTRNQALDEEVEWLTSNVLMKAAPVGMPWAEAKDAGP